MLKVDTEPARVVAPDGASPTERRVMYYIIIIIIINYQPSTLLSNQSPSGLIL